MCANWNGDYIISCRDKTADLAVDKFLEAKEESDSMRRKSNQPGLSEVVTAASPA